MEVCKEKGIEPRKQFSGEFNLRIPPELHEKLALAAQTQAKSLHSLAQEALERGVTAWIVGEQAPQSGRPRQLSAAPLPAHCLPLRDSATSSKVRLHEDER